jgi:glycosyltransferase involved in cell wall biosynthesis
MTKSVAIMGARGYPSFYGGFETLLRQLCPYLADQGWDVTVYSRPGNIEADHPSRDPRIASVITRGFDSTSLSTLSYGFTAAQHASRRKPDVALVMNVANGYWLPLLKARGIPTVVNVDGLEWERAKWGRAAKAVFRGGASLTAKFADTLVMDSLEIRRKWEEMFDRTGVFIPYGGAAPAAHTPGEFPRRSYALMVARFVPENTVDEFFDAAENLSKRWPVVIVGSSGYGGRFDTRARGLAAMNERVSWLGHVKDDDRLFGLWRNAGAYFHGHSVGGTNPALVQAMACGAPTVARDTVYNREVLEDAGVFVQPDCGEISSALARLLSDEGLQDRLSASAIARQQQAYSWRNVCEQYSQTLDAMLSSVDSHAGYAS